MRWVRHIDWNLAGLATAVAIVVAWELVVQLSVNRFESLPPPTQIAVAAVELARSGQLWIDFSHTLVAALAGWLLASAAGLALGVVLIQSRLLHGYALATIEVLRPLPPVAFVPVAVLAFGFSIATELSVMVLPCLWPVLINTMTALRQTPERLLEVACACRLSPLATLTRLRLPQAFPTIMVGLRLALSLALVLAVVTEMIGNPEGMGYAMVREQQALRADAMFAYLFLIGLTGVALNAGLRTIGRTLFPGWRHVLD
jgi:ABC-type nitrate/sulfonate/bicarbonate transport system permease component